MRDLFPGYYRPTTEQLQTLWKESIFIFDTNVLLDLYRYPKSTRDELLALFEKISERVWIPFQVALEYQENRLSVISEQIKRYDEVRSILNDFQNKLTTDLSKLQLKKRHSAIDPEGLLYNIDTQIKSFLSNVQKLRQEQPDVHDDDRLREKIDALFVGKIGSKPASQAELDKLYEAGKIRYDRFQPPGYMDKAKDRSDKHKDTKEKDLYVHDGLIFRKEFGDLILWQQIIDEVASRKTKYVIFITNDEKEDWWLEFDSSGKRIIGPRHELVEEITTKAGVSLFYMYNTERFLLFAKDYFKVPVSNESINQVRDITTVSQSKVSSEKLWMRSRNAEQAVFNWLASSDSGEELRQNMIGFPDFILIQQDDRKIGYDVRYISDNRATSHKIREPLLRGYYETSEGKLDQFNTVVVCDSLESVAHTRNIISGFDLPTSSKISIIYGILNIEDEKYDTYEPKFTPIS